MPTSPEVAETFELTPETAISILEQLNRTLELIQAVPEYGGVICDSLTARQRAEYGVLNCIEVFCTRVVIVKGQSS